jgi:LmbE family N-acetylglucosaminyl deacetylase
MSDLTEKNDFSTYLLVVAHPDDAEFPAAGTICRLTDQGKRVIIAQVTSGDKGSPDPNTVPSELAARREAEQQEASRREGSEVVFLRFPDGEVEPNLKLREAIVRMIRTYKPDVVITHDPFRPYAFHPDHRAVGYAASDSVYPTARDPLYFKEHFDAGLEPHKTAEIWYFGSEAPDLFVDVTDYFDRKIDALQAHVSQVGSRPKEEFAKGLRERLADLAKDQPFELAEAFKVVQMRR